MDLHSLTNTPGARSTRKRLGRGMASGKGKTSGKGHKGQMARKGNKHKPGFEGGQMRLIRRLPKRGFKNPARRDYFAINVGDLELLDEGTVVNRALLAEKGLANGPIDGVKVLGNGELKKKLTVQAVAFSATAREKIEAAGGSCEIVVD